MKDPRHYSVFGEGKTGGNPAAVVLDAGGLAVAEMKRMARELGVPTTAFVVEEELTRDPSLALRFFTPATEVAMCGHATIAAVTALVDDGRLVPGPGGATLALRASGRTSGLCVHRETGARPLVEVGLPPARFRDTDVDRRALEEALGDVESDAALPLAVGNAGLWHVLVAFPEIVDLARLDPDWDALKSLCKRLGVDTVCAFASRRDAEGCWRMRDLCGAIGNREEPASGTTSGALVAYLVRSGVLDGGGTLQVDVRQGHEMGRPSRIRVRREPVGAGAARLSVLGSARPVRTAEAIP